MFPDERSRTRYDRLARLLSEARGPEVLAEMLKTDLRRREVETPREAGTVQLGPWTVRDGALHRRDQDDGRWSPVEYVPPAGDARRVVLVGESAARGWPLAPAFSCAIALERNLRESGDGVFQVVDLTKVGATPWDLAEVTENLPALYPDVVVIFAGNNVYLPPRPAERVALLENPDVMDRLADGLRDEGYAGLRRVLEEVADDRCRGILDPLVPLAAEGVRVILVVPEFNLAGWWPDEEAVTSALPGDALGEWYGLLGHARRASEAGRWEEVGPLARRMAAIDGGASSAPGHLAGRAAYHLGNPLVARRELENSRDAECNLLLNCAPRTTRRLQELLVTTAAERGWSCVDLREVLGDPDASGLPRNEWFHDYCHMSDSGIERAMAAVTDAILDRPGDTTPAGPGVVTELRALSKAHAGIHLAWLGQPAEVVCRELRAAIALDPGLSGPLLALRDMLSGPTPRWSNPSASTLLSMPAAHVFLSALADTEGLTSGLWILRHSISSVLGAENTQDGDTTTDMLLGPHGGSQSLPTLVQPPGHHQATSQRSRLFFALDRRRDADLELTYRMPWAAATAQAALEVNGTEIATVPASARWRDTVIGIPSWATRGGVNEFVVCWPIPYEDVPARHIEDAVSVAGGRFPYVLPRFGELFTALVHPGSGGGREPASGPGVHHGPHAIDDL